MEFTEVDKKVIRGIRHAVDARGEDWRYPNGRVDGERVYDFTPDPAWTNEEYGLLREKAIVQNYFRGEG